MDYRNCLVCGWRCNRRKKLINHILTGCIPEGVDGKVFARKLLDEYNLEIGGGLGELAGKVWRVGLMGYDSRPEVVDSFVDVLKKVL
jgi:alanine-glyoxylate transaminase / serine-glyoxylate transaminase / serine-pyruvate transaminase